VLEYLDATAECLVDYRSKTELPSTKILKARESQEKRGGFVKKKLTISDSHRVSIEYIGRNIRYYDKKPRTRHDSQEA